MFVDPSSQEEGSSGESSRIWIGKSRMLREARAERIAELNNSKRSCHAPHAKPATGRSMVTGHSQAPCPSHKKLKSEKPERGDMMAVIEEELSDSDEYGPEIILSIGAPVPRQM